MVFLGRLRVARSSSGRLVHIVHLLGGGLVLLSGGGNSPLLRCTVVVGRCCCVVGTAHLVCSREFCRRADRSCLLHVSIGVSVGIPLLVCYELVLMLFCLFLSSMHIRLSRIHWRFIFHLLRFGEHIFHLLRFGEHIFQLLRLLRCDERIFHLLRFVKYVFHQVLLGSHLLLSVHGQRGHTRLDAELVHQRVGDGSLGIGDLLLDVEQPLAVQYTHPVLYAGHLTVDEHTGTKAGHVLGATYGHRRVAH
mmetsp:Transcript_13769/g.41514  ORF Transcript_13769/g.41514 Transcript_13769/m.41514 type:complete len:249 (+) Transcript_13769:1387-2133(+)